MKEDHPIGMLGFVEVGAVVAALAGGSVGEVMPTVAPTCRIEAPLSLIHI